VILDGGAACARNVLLTIAAGEGGRAQERRVDIDERTRLMAQDRQGSRGPPLVSTCGEQATPDPHHDEWIEQRRYLGLDVLKQCRAVLNVDHIDNQQEVTLLPALTA
jgi:hypothetical protein